MRWRCLGSEADQLGNEDEAVTNPKPYDIPKRMVLEAYRRVKANRGAAGIDGMSLTMFEADLSRNLYKLWNRLSSGSYLPPPVKQVQIPKKQGGVRILGVPTVADRIAQQVVVERIGADLFGVFDPDSHGYQLGKSAADAVAVTRQRCWEYDWVVEFDIRRAYDELHYAFDRWMKREHPRNPFARYADDAVAHCRSECEASALLAAIDGRLKECKLEMHPEKSGVVYCKDSNRRKTYPKVNFTFLGYEFRPRRVQRRDGKLWTNFLPAVSEAAKKRMRDKIREWQIPRETSISLHELAKRYNHHLRGWLNYFSHFRKSETHEVCDYFDHTLMRWARRKYRKLSGKWRQSENWLTSMKHKHPRLFVSWLASGRVPVRTMGAV
jgi:RNA-directed DNA polymerase